jgi:hypothetical protein
VVPGPFGQLRGQRTAAGLVELRAYALNSATSPQLLLSVSQELSVQLSPEYPDIGKIIVYRVAI